ncbi:shikimate kinase [Paenibacillus cymbidii]|uniref:shikimate kinase n=1 Tax=Paenibacillus cymbidii TaxID=1639034 RepID=UPI00108154A0|nr:shikimate kinase [Paenibacillus cymbidii]
MKWHNIVLVGFMGTGKTSVGGVLAGKLGWRLVGTDEEIERREGRTIPELFAGPGETYFRDVESGVIADVMSRSGQVVATGGGAVLAPRNREAMRAGGIVVALTASAETIIARVNRDSNRPLLQGNAHETVPQLMEKRKHAYDFADVTVATDGLTVEQIAETIVRLSATYDRPET